MDELLLDCGAVEVPIDPSAGPGNLYPLGAAPPVGPVFQVMVFENIEAAPERDKLFWSVAIGFDPAWFSGGAPRCTLETRATASHGPLAGGTTPADNDYPFIEVAVAVDDGTAVACGHHGLDEDGSGVVSTYTGVLPDASGFASTTFGFEGRRDGDELVTEAVLLPPGAPEGYVRIEAGTFLMGSPAGEWGRDPDEVQHEVTIRRPFWMKATEVTQAEWLAVMEPPVPAHFSVAAGFADAAGRSARTSSAPT